MSEQFTTMNDKASYAVGQQMGQQLIGQPFDGMEIEAVKAGIADALAGVTSQVSEDDMRAAIEDLNKRMMSIQEKQSGAQAEEGEAFLKDNATRAEVSVTDSGLQYEVLSEGNGEKPEASSTVEVHYHGTLINGTVFDSSVDRGETIEFPVGGVIAGWTEALQLMPTGSKWKLFIPHNLAYGANGAGGAIGPYAALVFEVELIAVK